MQQRHMTSFIWVMFNKFASREVCCSIRASRGCSIRATDQNGGGQGKSWGRVQSERGIIQVRSLSSMAGSLWVQELLRAAAEGSSEVLRATRFILSMAIRCWAKFCGEAMQTVFKCLKICCLLRAIVKTIRCTKFEFWS